MPNDSVSAETSGVSLILRNRGETFAVILLVAVVAIGATIYFWRSQHVAVTELSVARAQASRAAENFTATRSAIDTIVSDVGDGLATTNGTQAGAAAAILTKVEHAVDALVTRTQKNPELLRSQASMCIQFSTTFLALNDTKRAVEIARKGTEIFRAMAAEQPNNNALQSDVGLSLGKLSEALRASGDGKGALAADRESLEIARALADKDPGNKQFRTDVVLALWRLAAVGDNARERLTEALKLLKNLKLAAMLTPEQEGWIATIESDLAKL
jgi:hypothetical protein